MRRRWLSDGDGEGDSDGVILSVGLRELVGESDAPKDFETVADEDSDFEIVAELETLCEGVGLIEGLLVSDGEGDSVTVAVAERDGGVFGSPPKAMLRTRAHGSLCIYVLRKPTPMSKKVLAKPVM